MRARWTTALPLVLACAPAPKITSGAAPAVGSKIVRGGAPPSGPPVLVLAHDLGVSGRSIAFGSGFPEGTTIDDLRIRAGHSLTTQELVASVRGAGATSLSLVALTAVSSSELDPLSTYWRQGQRRGVTRPPTATMDRWGRFVTATSTAPTVGIEVDLGLRYLPKRRTDAVLAAFTAEALEVAGRAFRLERHGGRFELGAMRGPLRVLTVGAEVDRAGIRPAASVPWRVTTASAAPLLGRGRHVRLLGTVQSGLPEALVVDRRAPGTAGLLIALEGEDEQLPLLGLPAPAPDPLARHQPHSAVLARRFVERTAPDTTADPGAKRAALRSLFELAPPKPGHLLIRDDAGELMVEEWALPTEAGTTGAMRLAYARSTPMPAPVLLYLCGHFPSGIRNKDVTDLLREGARRGFVVAAVDLMGHGLREGGEAGHVVAAYLTLAGRPALRMFLEETEAALATVAAHPVVDTKRIGVAGVSMGGTLALLVAALSDRVAAAVAVAGSPDFAAYVRPIGSDAEQHTWRFAATSGLEGLPALVAPRPLSLIFAQRDPEHGSASSRGVVEAGKVAYAEHPTKFQAMQGSGLHDQGPATRRDVLNTMQGWLTPTPPPRGVPIGSPLPPTREREIGFRGLVSQARSAVEAHAATRTKAGHDRLDSTPFAGPSRSLGAVGPGAELYSLPAGDDQLRTTMLHLTAAEPVASVLVLDAGGRPGAVTAPLLRRCGFDVFVAEPRTFGTAASWNEAWDRQLLALASASLDQPLPVALVRDVATAVAAAKTLGRGIDEVLATGPEAGVVALLAASAGVFDTAHLTLGDAPAPYRWLLAHDHPPYWSGLLPGLLAQTDLDLIAASLQGRLTVTGGAPALVPEVPPPSDPGTGRFDAVRALLERYDRVDCVVRLSPSR